MAETEKTTAKSSKGGDAGQAEVQDRMDEINAKGYVGDKVDPLDDEEYSLLSGPDSPPHVPDNKTRAGVPQAKE